VAYPHFLQQDKSPSLKIPCAPEQKPGNADIVEDGKV
jgi:hypothetical protein